MVRTWLEYIYRSKIRTFFAIGVFFVLCGVNEGKNCVQVSNCKCTFDDGSGTVDLSAMGRQDNIPMLQDQFAKDNYAYSFNPCYPFDEGTCKKAAACQYDSNNNVHYNIGDANKVTFSFDGTNVVGTYVADDNARTSVVTFKCDPNVDPPADTANGETTTSHYSFTVTSKYCCPQGNPGPGPGPGPGPHVEVSVSISVGSILLIAFFSILVIYLVAGVLFNKFYRHNTGKEVIPNANVIVEIPGLIKDGCLFLVGKVTRRGGYQKA